ncbi:MAG: serine/threonine-protein kinase [Planctomycetia bacterium]|nr:serine/threonine-protein kinase [Planctomycetia bacterium]
MLISEDDASKLDQPTQRRTSSPDPDTSTTDSSSPTYTPEAESLLAHLKLGVTQSAARSSAIDRPTSAGYEILDELGRGGMGVVFRARHIKLNRIVALKMILAADRAAPGEVARFLAEAEAVAAVKHPNVVQVYDSGDADGLPFFAMEFVDGGTLSTLLKDKGSLPPTLAAELLEAVARGVQAAHDAGIVHRDLKPGNILLSAERGTRNAERKTETQETSSGLNSALRAPSSALVPKVTDFGLAKRMSSDLTRTQAVMGTPTYMAPEQAGKAKFVGPGADVYALGVILYECLTGKPPFESDNPWSLIRQVLDEAPEAPSKRMPGVPRDLELICLKCLEKQPHHRYLSALELADDLKRFLKGEPVSVRPIGSIARAARWAKRNPAPTALIALVALLLVVVPPLAVWNQARIDRRDAVAEQAQQKQEQALLAEKQAKRAEEQAKRAEEEAKKAQAAAEKLAEARELFGLQNRLRNRAMDRPLGWTWANRTDLTKAVTLAGTDSEMLGELRSAAAVAILAPDLRPVGEIQRGFTTGAAATDPKSGRIALGEFKAWGKARVRLVNPTTGQTMRTFVVPTDFLGGVQDGVRSLAFSPDASRLFVGTRGSKVMRFDLDKPGKEHIARWTASSNSVDQLAVSPDGKMVYGLCSWEGAVFVWSAEKGKLLQKLTPTAPAHIRSFAILPSGDVIACNGHHIHRWTADFKLVQSVENRSANKLVATTASMLVVGEGPHLTIYTPDALERIARFDDLELHKRSHEESLRPIVVHPSGAFVATASGDSDRTVKIWALASGRLIGTVTAPGTTPISLAWSADGRFLLASASTSTLGPKGQPLITTGFVARWEFVPSRSQTFTCINGQLLSTAAFMPGNRVVAISEPTEARREVLVSGSASEPAVRVLFDEAGGNGWPGVNANPSGKLAVTRHRPGIVVWKPGESVPPVGFTEKSVRCPRFSPDGQTLWAIVNSSDVHAYDPVTRALRAEWSNSFAEVVSGLASLNALAVGRSAAVAGGRDGSVYWLDLTTCRPKHTFPAAGDPVLSVALSPDESLIVAGTQNGKLRIMRLSDKTELPAVIAHPGGVSTLTINHDGTLLATGGRDRVVRLWKRVNDQFELLLAVSDLPSPVRELQFSPTADRLLVLLAYEHAGRVWDIARLKTELGELKLAW